jgi:hypothetical protein
MNKKMMEMDDDVENTGIMQGFMDSMADEGDDEGDEDPQAMMDRRPDTPEILMNNLRGDMRSVDARRDELADLVGYQAAKETPDQVLAMLQPVLAQQGGGGIGALPQSQDMAQGPQPPMMGGAPGMPPPGMPPMPPDAGMPPPPQQGGIAELMAGLGGGAPGGAGAPPMPPGAGMPPSDQPPVAMARGGYVQNFQVGSDERGVTPADDDESSSIPPAGTYPADLVERARSNMNAMLAQKPMAVPDLAKTSEERARMYGKILGDNTESRQAQMLMALGQRAFNFGANTDDQGRPLRGGFGARLAGAARTLPGEMAGFIAQTDKEQRQLKLLGLQAAEKEVEAAKTNNIKVMETQRKFYADILKSEGKKGKSPFGSGREGGALELFVKLSPDFAAGKTTEEQDRYFLTAVSDYTRPTQIQVVDPITQAISYRTQQNPLPDFVKTALKTRKMGVPSAATSGSAAPAPAPAGGPAATVTPVAAPGDVNATPVPAGGAAAAPAAAPEPRTIWNQSSFIAGPVPAIQAGVSRIPGLGGVAPDVQQARTFVNGAVRELVKNLQNSPVFAQREREAIESEVDIGPRFFDDPEGLRNRMIGVDDFLATKIREADVFAKSQEATSKARGEALNTVQAITNFRKILGVPVRVYSVDDVQKLQPGTPFLWNGTQPRVRQ